MGFVNSATNDDPPARLSNAGARLLKRCGLEQVRHAVRVTVGGEWSFVLCRASGAMAEKGSGVGCPGALVFGEKVRMGAERGTAEFPVRRWECGG